MIIFRAEMDVNQEFTLIPPEIRIFGALPEFSENYLVLRFSARERASFRGSHQNP
jgi:hypothetical protein